MGQRAIEPAVAFLEVDAVCLRAGYAKEQLCRYLGRMDLPPRARRRLSDAAERALADPRRPGREKKTWARLEERLHAAAARA